MAALIIEFLKSLPKPLYFLMLALIGIWATDYFKDDQVQKYGTAMANAEKLTAELDGRMHLLSRNEYLDDDRDSLAVKPGDMYSDDPAIQSRIARHVDMHKRILYYFLKPPVQDNADDARRWKGYLELTDAEYRAVLADPAKKTIQTINRESADLLKLNTEMGSAVTDFWFVAHRTKKAIWQLYWLSWAAWAFALGSVGWLAFLFRAKATARLQIARAAASGSSQIGTKPRAQQQQQLRSNKRKKRK